MFERFTERARKVVVLAQEESRRLQRGYVGTEHLLLGLIREGEGVAAQALHACGVTLDEARERVESIVGYGEGDASQRPFTPRAKRVLEFALREAQDLRHDHIGTEHLLLGLIQDEDGIAGRALKELEVNLDEAREQVEIIVGYGEEGSEARAPFTPRASKVLQMAQMEAMQLDRDHVSTEHILLGLANEVEGVAARVFTNLEVDPDAIRREIVRRLPGEETGHDVPDDTAPSVEEEEAPRLLFRGRVGGVRTGLALPRPVSVTIEADYSYMAPAGTSDGSATVAPGEVAEVLRSGIDEADVPILETVITALGEGLLDSFPAMLEVGVTVLGPPEPSNPPAPTFYVSATFRR